jgi:hypothetical protein
MTEIDIDLVLPNGNPLANAPFTIIPSRADFTDSLTGVVMPRMLELTTDALGKATVSLWPNEVPYYLEAQDCQSDAVIFYKFIVPVIPANTSVRLQDLLSDSAVPNSHTNVAALRQSVSTALRQTTRGYWADNDGGAATYELAGENEVCPGDNAGTVIERDDGRWYRLKPEGQYINISQLGVYCAPVRREVLSGTPGVYNRWSGAVPSTHLAPPFLPETYSTADWFHAAKDQIRAARKSMLIDGVVHADKQIILDAPIKIDFAGKTGRAAGNLDLNLPDSYIFQANSSMVGAVVLRIEHPGIWITGGGVVGPVYYDSATDFYYPEGLARDGVFIGSNSLRWDNGVVARMGRDGWRIGDYTGGSGTNANSVYLDGCASAYNGNNGLTINDASGILDANVFQIDNFFTHHNQNSGIELANTFLGGIFNAPTVEANGRGWFINNTASGIVINGGDTEANNGWQGGGALQNIVEDPAVQGRNFFNNHTVQEVIRTDIPSGSTVRNNHAFRTSFGISNTNTAANADVLIGLTTSAGNGGLRKVSAVSGGDLQLGNEGPYPLMFGTNSINRIGLNANGALLLSNATDTGSPGMVCTSAGPGASPIWTVPAAGGSTSPLTTKGDLFTYSTAAARLPVGGDGQVLTANSASPTGLGWSTITGTGTVTSVGMSVPTGLQVSGGPITAAGTLALSYAPGYQGFLATDKTKLDGITVADLATKSAQNVFTGPIQTVSNSSFNSTVGFGATNLNGGTTAHAQVVVESNAGPSGMIQLSVAGGGQLVVGNYSSRGVALMQNGIFRVYLENGFMEFRGLPGSSGGNPERVWRDGSGFLRIG